MSDDNLSFNFVNDKPAPVPLDTWFTEAQALEAAQRLLGYAAYTYDRDAHEVSRKARIERPSIQRFYVGTGSECYGNGDNWSAALEAAVRMKEVEGGNSQS